MTSRNDVKFAAPEAASDIASGGMDMTSAGGGKVKLSRCSFIYVKTAASTTFFTARDHPRMKLLWLSIVSISIKDDSDHGDARTDDDSDGAPETAAEAAGVGCSVAAAPGAAAEAAGVGFAVAFAPGAATCALALVFGAGSVFAFFGDFGLLSPIAAIAKQCRRDARRVRPNTARSQNSYEGGIILA